MTDTTSQYEEMEDRMHILALVDTIEHSTSNITNTLGNNPNDRSRRNRINERLESNQHGKSHTDETNGFQIAVILQPAKLMTVPAIAHAQMKQNRLQPQ